MTKKPRKPTIGERLAVDHICGGDWGAPERRDIARRIDSAIRRAVKEGFACGANMGTDLAREQRSRLNRKYGVKL